LREQAEVNRFVLDYLRDGPAQLDRLYSDAFAWGRVPSGQVNGALMHFRVKSKVSVPDGAKYVAIAENVVGIWWARSGRAFVGYAASTGGNSAA
jgi:hypothetical protein